MMSNDHLATRIATPLLLLRVTVALFLAQWGVEKIISPEMTTGIFTHFYGFAFPSNLSPALGIAEVLLALAVLIGFQKKISYGIAFLIHGVSTLATWKQLIDPYGLIWGTNSHLFAAAVPVLAAMWLLYVMRDADTKLSLG